MGSPVCKGGAFSACLWYNVQHVLKDERREIFMILYMDTRQQEGKHELKIQYWKSQGIELVTKKLDYGDYMLEGNDTLSIDTKKDFTEIEGNLIHDHKRLVRECDRAEEAGVRLIFVVENECGICNLAQVDSWQNPRYWAWKFKHDRGYKGKECTSGPKLRRIMETFERRHNATFLFTSPEQSGRLVLDLLRQDQ